MGIPERVAYMEGQVSELSNTLAAMRADLSRLEQRIDAGFVRVDEKMSRQFYWLVGMQVTTLVAVLGVLLARSQ
jgi:hypothetical protein